MQENVIKLKESNTIKMKIITDKGEDTGEYLEFDLEDIDLPLRYQEMLEKHKKNENDLSHKFIIIDKKEDIKGKKLLSSNTEEKLRALKEYYRKDMEALDLFLGKGKTQLILKLMGRRPYYTMFDDFGEMLKPIIPVFEENMDITEKNIISKYGKEEENVLQ